MIFAIDLDGTLLDSNKKIRPASKKAITIAQNKGHLVIPITGRSFMGVKEYMNELNIKKYIVINNGSSIYNVEKNTFHNYPPISKKIILELMDIAKKEKIQFSLHGVKKTIRCSFADDKIKYKVVNDWAETISVDDFKKTFPKMNVMQASLKGPEDIVKKWNTILSNKYLDLYQVHNTGIVYLDINSKNVSKYEALLWIIDKEKLSKDDLVAFGDSNNDIQMIIGAKIGIAMANANKEIIEKANEVITNNDTDGIAKRILELI